LKTSRQRQLARDRDVVETLVVTAIVCLLSLGCALVVAWLRVVIVAAGAAPINDGRRVLVCGHRLERGKVSGDYRRRLDELARVMNADPEVRGVLLGGGQPSEARVGLDYLQSAHGIDPARVCLEEHSQDTLENLRHARNLVGPGTREEPLRIVSNRYHLARLTALSGTLGLKVRLHPADGRVFGIPGRLPATLVEAGFLCWFTTGRVWARLMGRRRMLARIQ